jgi:glycosyltransferase involved in cell wall biosynthesis
MISVVTPTLRRPQEVCDLLANLSEQTLLPGEVVLVDGAPPEEKETEEVIRDAKGKYPFDIRYIRHGGGTAIQRNVGIEAAEGSFVAFVDDDVRLDSKFFEVILKAFSTKEGKHLGGIVGYRRNLYFKPDDRQRWRWYRRLNLLSTYVPGEYDFKCGYPINATMQPPFNGLRKVQFMTTACAMWRREVLDSGLRFDPFFRDYGVLEDAHFSLRAGRTWDLAQCGDALCTELHAAGGRVNRRRIGYKCVVNYYYVFNDIVGPLTWAHQFRFWRYQTFELFRVTASAARRRRRSDLSEVRGRLEGVWAVLRGITQQSATITPKDIASLKTFRT